jgi:hypothetical protein
VVTTSPCKTKSFGMSSNGVETEEEVTVIDPSRVLSAKEFVVGQAAPIPIFEKILGYLSPGYIWIFGRRVRKSWKQAIEQFIVRSVFSKGLIQILMWNFRNYYVSFDDVNYRIHSVIYRCSDFDSKRNVFIFTAFKTWGSYSISGPLIEPTTGSSRCPHWKVLDVISSIFPARWVDIDYYKYPREPHLYRTATVIYYSDPKYYRERIMTLVEIDKFHSQPLPSSEPTTPPEETPLRDAQFSNLCFATPEVFIDLRFGKYLFKCRYITKLSIWPRGNIWGGRNWRQDWTLIIDRVEVKFADFLTWKCGCEKLGDKIPCPVESLLVPYNKVSTTEKPPRRGCMFAVDLLRYRRDFQFLPCADKHRLTSKLATLGEPAVAAFIPTEFEQKPKPRPPPTPHVSCSACVAGIADGRFARDGMGVGVKWASARCVNKLCGRCCAVDLCKGHDRCFVCRERKYKGGAGERKCLQIYGTTCHKYRRGGQKTRH